MRNLSLHVPDREAGTRLVLAHYLMRMIVNELTLFPVPGGVNTYPTWGRITSPAVKRLVTEQVDSFPPLDPCVRTQRTADVVSSFTFSSGSAVFLVIPIEYELLEALVTKDIE